MSIIAISNQKGGAGKTALSRNLSAALSRKGKRVLAIDLDPQSTLTKNFGLKNVSSQADMSFLFKITAETILSGSNANLDYNSFIRNCSGVDVIPNTISMSGAEVSYSGLPGKERILELILQPLKSIYDYIVLDCPPSLNLILYNALTAADKLIIPTPPRDDDVMSLTDLLKSVNVTKRFLNPNLSVGGVAFMFDTHTKESKLLKATVIKMIEELNITAFETSIPQTVKGVEAARERKSVFEYCPKHQLADAYDKLATEVIENGI